MTYDPQGQYPPNQDPTAPGYPAGGGYPAEAGQQPGNALSPYQMPPGYQPSSYYPPTSDYGIPPYPPVAPTASQRTSGFAIASLVLGILGCTPVWIGFVLCVLAIVFGGIGISKTGPGGAGGRGLAIAGLILGCLFLIPAAFGL